MKSPEREIQPPARPVLVKPVRAIVPSAASAVSVLPNKDVVEPKVFHLNSDLYVGSRTSMNAIGLDIGTKNIVMVFVGKDGKSVTLHEINGYFVYPNPSKFVERMLDDPEKVRSDGTKRPARWVKFGDTSGVYVLGRDAEELAYAHNDTLSRSMADGGIAKNEDAMMVLAAIVQGLLEMAEKELGKFDSNVTICYCTTAHAINASTNIDYHRRVIDLIIEGYETKAAIKTEAIKESHAIVLKENPDGTGIGISWGAGTVTVSYVLWGNEIYSFSWVGGGDWIDLEVARRHGYDPDHSGKKSKETPTTVCRVKEKIDLSKSTYENRLELDIVLHYKILIANVIHGIVQGFKDNESNARIDKPIGIYMAGGTCIPSGFEELVSVALAECRAPFEISTIVKCKNPLFAVAEGCLIVAGMQ